MTCKNCKHYNPTDEQSTSGACRRNPPTLVYFEEEQMTMTAFPKVSEATWCGEFEPEFQGMN
jgi:hypothetical protein